MRMQGQRKLPILIGGGLIIVVLVIGGILFLNSKKDSNLDTALEAEVENSETSEAIEAKVETEPIALRDNAEISEDDESTPSVWSFNTEVVSNWPNPVPKVNPLGEADLYDEIQYETNGYFQFNYYTNQLYAKTRNAYGNLWYLSIPKQENSEDPEYDFYIRDFKRYIVEIGGTIEGTHSYGVVFSIEDQHGAQHWGQLTDNSDSFRLDIISETSLRPGETVDINPEDHPYNEATFMIYNPDTDFISAEIFLEGGTISLDIYQELAFDAYKRDQVYSATLDSEIETYYRLNDLPLDEQVAVCKVSWNDSPEKLQFKLHALGGVTKIRGSEDLGAVIISAKEADGVAFFPDGKNTSIVHPEYAGAPIVDRTEEGDFLVYLPSGLWRAEITPKGKSLVNQYGTQLIPVQAGYQTRVELPYLLEKAFSIKDGADLSTEGLKIENIKELGDTVQFDFSLVDKRTEGIDPNMENTIVREGSDPVELVSITSVLTPPSVALLIDSSGSMKGQMEATLKAAETFIEGLPEGTHLRVIDFDTEVRVFEGKTKAEGIQALKDISVGGYTALYDGILESIALIENLERATLVVFTDGTNELPDHKITPDMTSLDAVIAGLEASSVQLFGIGFGEGHDGAVLKTVSKIGGGQYFSAEDQNALSAVFTAINDKINATYTATYKRPTQVAPSDVPIVNIVVDISGSMDMEWDETTGHRMEKMKNLFHGFIAQLPDHTQIQIMSFNNEVYVNQLLTSDKLKALRALSLLQAGGGTNILDSVKVGYKTLAAIPSTQKVMVYLTDAALSVSDEDRAEFDTILDEIAEEGVNVLWLGLGEGLNEADFLSTAERSGGAYVISEDATIIKQSTDALLASMQTETLNSMSTVSIQVRKEEEDGLAAYFSASALAKLTPVKQVGKAELVDAVRYEIGAKLDQYDAKTSKFLSGDQLPKEAVKILKRIDLNETRQNEAMAIHADELVFLGAFNGVQAPDEMRFAAVFLKLDHVLPKQEVIVYPDGSGHPANWVGASAANGKKVVAEVPYVIPNVFNHFSLTYNNTSTHPVSPATWIAETPLVAPGETSVNLEPQSDLEGVLVFLVPKTGMDELSLHYYDTDYGHIHMPLVGEMALVPESLEALPLDVGTDFHKGFKLMVDQTTGEASIGKHVNANDNNIFNVVRGRFQAMVQANLSLNPQERIHLISKTDQGDFYYPIHSATELLPYGMLAEQMVSPGAQNPVSFAFLMPEALENTGTEILVDLVNEDVRVPAKSGSIFSTGPALATSSHDYFDVKINQLGYSNGDIAEFGSDFIVLDISFFDHKDGFASRGVIDSFRLVHEGHQIQDLMEDPDLDQVIEKRLELALSSSGLSGFASPRLQENELVVGPSAYTSELVLGLDDDTIIYDGTARRGFVIFRVHPDTPYTLQSTLFEDLNVPVSKGEFDLSLLTRKAPYVYEDGYTQALSAAIEASILRYEAQKTDLSQAQLKAETLDPDSEAILDVDAPMMSLAGALKFKDVSTLDELRALLNTVSVVYDPQDYGENQALYTYAHSPEAILTQGWGTISDVTHAAIRGLSKLGYQPKRHVVRLSGFGRSQLGTFLNDDSHGIYQLPAISFEQDGEMAVWLMPYMKDFSRLASHGSYYLDGDTKLESDTVGMRISYLIKLNGNSFAAKAAEASSALSGSTDSNEPYWEEVFGEYLSLSDLSNGCMDLGVTTIKKGYTPLVNTLSKTYVGTVGIDPNGYDFLGIRIELDLKGNPITHEMLFPEDVAIEDVFATIGVNLPNMTSASYKVLAEAAETIHAHAETTTDISTLKWYGRSVIAKYMGLQNAFENRVADGYGLNIAHIGKDQGVIVTQMVYNGKHVSRIDLLNPVTPVIVTESNASEMQAECNSYYLMSGLHASVAEAGVLENGMGILEMWASLPDTTDFMLIPEYVSMDAFRERFLSLGMTEEMVAHFEYNNCYILIPSNPALVNGIERWAWFEMNPSTYEVISVLDDFTRGGLGEKAVIDAFKSGGQYLLGVLAGVETSLWSVASFSLMEDDYDVIRKKAYEFALGLKPFFNLNSGPASLDFGSSEGSFGVGPIKGNFGRVDGDWQASAGENVLGFTNGYEEGVKLYFDLTGDGGKMDP